ncbi:hypothetical protein BDZ89DRAFT_140979 [Hymenopellis radicata]|nr:hypothetical protein BDZ89DRAFT_140979 [Hymenopellis radicata]
MSEALFFCLMVLATRLFFCLMVLATRLFFLCYESWLAGFYLPLGVVEGFFRAMASDLRSNRNLMMVSWSSVTHGTPKIVMKAILEAGSTTGSTSMTGG